MLCPGGRYMNTPGIMAHMLTYAINVGTMTSYRHVSLLFPLLPIILGFEKIPYYSKRNSSIMCVSPWLTIIRKPRSVIAITYFRVEKVGCKSNFFRYFLLPCFLLPITVFPIAVFPISYCCVPYFLLPITVLPAIAVFPGELLPITVFPIAVFPGGLFPITYYRVSYCCVPWRAITYYRVSYCCVSYFRYKLRIYL